MAKMLTTEEWIDSLGEFINWNEFSLGSEYSGNRNPISIVCNKCNESRVFKRANYLSEYVGEYYCKNCGDRSEKNVLELINYTEEKRYYGRIVVKNKNELLKRTDSVDVICNYCGNEKSVLVSSYISCKAGCRKCANSEKFDTDFVRKKIESMTDGEYTLVGEYINSQKSIKIKHNNDSCENHCWNTMYGNFVRHNRRCPICTFIPSVGEDFIENFLINNNINYKKQYRDNRCFYKRVLPFDFAVFDSSNNLSMLIEFDGIQHFSEERGFWGSEYPNEELKRVFMYDNIKNNFCKENNINLLRIPYWDFDNIEEILKVEILR